VTTLATPCELCEAAPLTERFYADDECFVVECESCFVPMVVLRAHVADPTTDTTERLHAVLLKVVAEHFDGAVWVDAVRRTIPDHYHAHARPRSMGGLVRRTQPTLPRC
jgi:hypothetical protein